MRALTQASYRSIKSYFTKTYIGHNTNKLKNQDILAQEFPLDIYYSSCFVRILLIQSQVAGNFKPVWSKNQVQLSTHLRRTYLQRIFKVFLQLMAITSYMLSEIVRSSFTDMVVAIRVNFACKSLRVDKGKQPISKDYRTNKL